MHKKERTPPPKKKEELHLFLPISPWSHAPRRCRRNVTEKTEPKPGGRGDWSAVSPGRQEGYSACHPESWGSVRGPGNVREDKGQSTAEETGARAREDRGEARDVGHPSGRPPSGSHAQMGAGCPSSEWVSRAQAGARAGAREEAELSAPTSWRTPESTLALPTPRRLIGRTREAG